ncbi:MAG TPA: hypothetical protein EYO33_32670 [Phycisphaerales bacterium]|nr:hypothetical protein [Phycisphaerales bacterium]
MIVFDLDSLPLTKKARKLLEVLEDFTPLLNRLAVAAQGIWTRKFRAEGPGWAPLSEATLLRRKKEGEGAQILRDTGRLFQSLTDSASEGSVFKLDSTTLEIGTNLEYAAVHQDGSQAKNIPRRPFLPDEDEIAPVFSRIIERYYKEFVP